MKSDDSNESASDSNWIEESCTFGKSQFSSINLAGLNHFGDDAITEPDITQNGSHKSDVSASKVKHRVLIVDDVSLIRKMMIKTLSPICSIVDEAEDGFNASKLFDSHDVDYYDIILCDCYMPEVSH